MFPLGILSGVYAAFVCTCAGRRSLQSSSTAVRAFAVGQGARHSGADLWKTRARSSATRVGSSTHGMDSSRTG